MATGALFISQHLFCLHQGSSITGDFPLKFQTLTVALGGTRPCSLAPIDKAWTQTFVLLLWCTTTPLSKNTNQTKRHLPIPITICLPYVQSHSPACLPFCLYSGTRSLASGPYLCFTHRSWMLPTCWIMFILRCPWTFHYRLPHQAPASSAESWFPNHASGRIRVFCIPGCL